MKRLMFVLALLGVLCVGSIVQARAPYPTYWNGDRNFPLVAGNQGLAWYLDKTSIRFKRVDNSSVLIACDVVQIDEHGRENYKTGKDGTLLFRDTSYYYYDESDTEMYQLKVENGNVTSERYIDPLGDEASSGRAMHIGEAAYYVACGRKFYGAYRWSNNRSKDIEVYSASFYSKL